MSKGVEDSHVEFIILLRTERGGAQLRDEG